MNPYQDPGQHDNSSKTAMIMMVLLLILVAFVFVLIFYFKPKTKDFDTKTGEIKNTPREHIEAIDPQIRKISNLSAEIELFDELFDELVYAETPDVNRIGDFVSSYHDFASLYSADGNRLNSVLTDEDEDTTIISFGRQNKQLKNSISALLASIEKKKKVFMTIPVTFPMEKKVARIVSGFGPREHPILKELRMHSGIDIAAPVGTAVVATASGKVVLTEEKPGYGRNCIVEHRFGYQTLYGHLVRLVVGKEQWLQKGDVVGYVGNTGLSEAPHLHYEIRKNGKPLNPSYFIFEGLKKEEYKEIISLGSKINEVLSF